MCYVIIHLDIDSKFDKNHDIRSAMCKKENTLSYPKVTFAIFWQCKNGKSYVLKMT